MSTLILQVQTSDDVRGFLLFDEYLQFLEIFDFALGQLSPVTGLQVAQMQVADGNAFQVDDLVSYGSKHLSYLTVLTFVDLNFHDGGVIAVLQDFYLGLGGDETADVYASAETLCLVHG